MSPVFAQNVIGQPNQYINTVRPLRSRRDNDGPRDHSRAGAHRTTRARRHSGARAGASDGQHSPEPPSTTIPALRFSAFALLPFPIKLSAPAWYPYYLSATCSDESSSPRRATYYRTRYPKRGRGRSCP